jgi:hypothetical protein
VLAHRLGLIPLLADPADFEERGEEDIANENNTIGAHHRHAPSALCV